MKLTFDRQEFKSLLIDSVFKAVSSLSNVTKGETVYAFGLSTNGEGSSVYPTANTEEALRRVALSYHTQYGGSYDLYCRSLRWSPGDWEYHTHGKEVFSPVQEYLERGWDEEFTQFEIDCNQIYRACIEVLIRHQDQKTFQEAFGQTQVVICLFTSDQSSEERLAWAKLLNDHQLSDKFAREMADRVRAFHKLSVK